MLVEQRNGIELNHVDPWRSKMAIQTWCGIETLFCFSQRLVVRCMEPVGSSCTMVSHVVPWKQGSCTMACTTSKPLGYISDWKVNGIEDWLSNLSSPTRCLPFHLGWMLPRTPILLGCIVQTKAWCPRGWTLHLSKKVLIWARQIVWAMCVLPAC